MKKYHVISAIVCLLAAFGCTACGESESSILLPEQSSQTDSADRTTTKESETTTETTAETTAESDENSTTENTTAISSKQEESSTSQSTSVTTTTTATAATVGTGSATYDIFELLTVGYDCALYVQQFTDYTLQEAPSCFGNGIDRVYTYADYTLYTYDEGYGNILQEINLTGSGVKTPEGAAVGMRRAQVEAIYGASADDCYATGIGVISFQYTGDVVSLIAVYENL